MTVLEVNNLTKYYGPLRALNNVSFKVPSGSVFGILGPNGSGKTTFLSLIMDILKPTSGNFSLLGSPNSNEIRKSIGTLLETPNFYHYLSGEKNLKISAHIKGKGLNDIDRVLEVTGMAERRHSKFSSYSLGMKQRLAIASCLLGDPDVLVFDEPTNGLDPEGIADIRSLILQLRASGKTIIMASHLLDEVEKVCTHVAILQKGHLLETGHVDEILVNEDIVEIQSDHAEFYTAAEAYEGKTGILKNGSFTQLIFPSGEADLEKINSYFFKRGIVLKHLRLQKKSLETKFFELTQKK